MTRRVLLCAVAYALLLALAVKAPVVVFISLILGFWLWGVLSHTSREMDVRNDILAPRDATTDRHRAYDADDALRSWTEGR